MDTATVRNAHAADRAVVGEEPRIGPAGAADLYDVIDGRYEKRGIALTSNRAPGEWPDLFDNALLANAALDRLADRAHVVSITGRSYRLARTVDGKEVPLQEVTPDAT